MMIPLPVPQANQLLELCLSFFKCSSIHNVTYVRTYVPFAIGCGLTYPFQYGRVSFVIAVTKVEAGNVHTALDESLQLLELPTRRSDRTNDLGSSELGITSVLDGIQIDESARQNRHLRRVGNRHCCFSIMIML